MRDGSAHTWWMLRCRLLCTALLVGAVALPATAGAAQHGRSHRVAAGDAVSTRTARAATPAPLISALAIARRYWGAVPCQGQISITDRLPVPTGLAEDSDAWVTFDSPLGVNDLAAPASGYTNCTIGFGVRRWPTTASMRSDWDMLCMTMIHELGHLLGHPHDATPGSIMAPVFTDYSNEPAMCRTSRPVGA
jgi:hypothetical protein